MNTGLQPISRQCIQLRAEPKIDEINICSTDKVMLLLYENDQMERVISGIMKYKGWAAVWQVIVIQ